MCTKGSREADTHLRGMKSSAALGLRAMGQLRESVFEKSQLTTPNGYGREDGLKEEQINVIESQLGQRVVERLFKPVGVIVGDEDLS